MANVYCDIASAAVGTMKTASPTTTHFVGFWFGGPGSAHTRLPRATLPPEALCSLLQNSVLYQGTA